MLLISATACGTLSFRCFKRRLVDDWFFVITRNTFADIAHPATSSPPWFLAKLIDSREIHRVGPSLPGTDTRRRRCRLESTPGDAWMVGILMTKDEGKQICEGYTVSIRPSIHPSMHACITNLSMYTVPTYLPTYCTYLPTYRR